MKKSFWATVRIAALFGYVCGEPPKRRNGLACNYSSRPPRTYNTSNARGYEITAVLCATLPPTPYVKKGGGTILWCGSPWIYARRKRMSSKRIWCAACPSSLAESSNPSASSTPTTTSLVKTTRFRRVAPSLMNAPEDFKRYLYQALLHHRPSDPKRDDRAGKLGSVLLEKNLDCHDGL